MGEFPVARLRIQRAMSHGERLSQIWNEIPTGRLCTPRVVVDPRGYGVLVATNVGQIPDEMPLLLGEMLYQLRSALDSCVYQGAVYATKQDPPPNEGQTEFPITSDANEWPRLKERRLSSFPAPIQEALERIQPYNTPSLPPTQLIRSVNRSLGILHGLARKDRHRKLHIVGSWPFDAKPLFKLPEGMVVESLEVMPPTILTDGTVIARFRIQGFRDGLPAYVNPQLRTTFGCDEPPTPCDPSDTFGERLKEMVNSVAGVIDYFERNF